MTNGFEPDTVASDRKRHPASLKLLLVLCVVSFQLFHKENPSRVFISLPLDMVKMQITGEKKGHHKGRVKPVLCGFIS